MRYEKIYLDITVRFSSQGKMYPLAFEWNGKSVCIDRVTDVKKAPPAHTGSFLTEKYTCLVCGKERFFYFESRTSRWFVEARCAD
ncbi:MAG: hypothetical protein DBX59_02970 [Bacillota bacterium]|nr:MAG: hypothetical protein DBX59_02970 [Bacillota bacterium]